MPTPTILVFGSTGAIGGSLIKRLMPDHAGGRIRLVATARHSEAAAKFEQLGVECRRIDLDHAEQQGLEPVVNAMRGVDRVFLLTSYDVKMLAQSKAVIDAAKQADVSHIVHLGAHASPATTIVHLGWHQMIEAYLSSRADPMYMACVRTIFERTRQGTLPDLAETSDALNRLRKRPATSIRSFAERHRDQFMTDVADRPG